MGAMNPEQSQSNNGEARIAVVTTAMGEGYGQLVSLGIESKIRYCKRTGHTFILVGNEFFTTPPDRPESWYKLKVIAEHLPDYDWIFWSDADVMMMNMDLSLTEILGRYTDPNKHVIYSDPYGEANMGHFFIRNSSESLEFLQLLWDQIGYINHYLWETGAFLELEQKNDFIKRVCHLETDRQLFHAIPHDYIDGDLLVHFAGVEDRYELMKAFKHPVDWDKIRDWKAGWVHTDKGKRFREFLIDRS